jgi:hypothetical protein
MFNWFVTAIFPNVPNDQKSSVSNDQKASSSSFDLSQIITAQSERIALKKYNEKHAETWNKNFEDCKKRIFENFIVGGKIEVECEIFMRPEDKQYIKETMTSKGYYVYSAQEMWNALRHGDYHNDKFYVRRSRIY